MVSFTRGMWWVVLGALVLYFLLVVMGDFREVWNSLREFPPVFLFVVLLLSLANYNIRFVKWDYLLRKSSIHLKRWESYSIFIAGFSGTCSPGKSGELVKPMLLSEFFGIEIQKTIPVFFFERLTDLIGLIFLSFIGIFAGRREFIPIVVLFGFIMIFLFFFTNPDFWKLVFGILGKKPDRGLFKLIYEISLNIHLFWNLEILVVTLFLSVVAWTCEGIGYYLVLKGIDQVYRTISLLKAIFIYSASTIFGAVTFVPGGLGVTDGSLTALAVSSGVSRSAAVLSTIIIRALTLWFAVLIGIGFFIYTQHRFKNYKKGAKK